MDKTLLKISYLLTEKRPFLPAEILSYATMPIRIEAKKCLSSNVEAYGYDKQSRTLKVVFSGGSEYRYLCVPEQLYQDLDKADSKGSFVAIVKRMCKAIRVDGRWYSLDEDKGPKAASPCFDCQENKCPFGLECQQYDYSLFRANNAKDKQPASERPSRNA
jgi:hypothetical protein